MFIISVGYILLFLTNFVFWWALFVITTIVGLVKLKFGGSPSYSMVTYYFVQELGGILFVLCGDQNSMVLFLLIKGGFSPLHNWLGGVLLGAKGISFVWMLSWQKVPYYIALGQLLLSEFLPILVVGGLLPLCQVIFLSSYKGVVFLLITSSGNNLLVYSFLSLEHLIFLLPLYLYTFYMVVGLSNSGGLIYVGVELMFVLMGAPGSLPFYLKMLIMSGLTPSGSLFLLVYLGGAVLFLVASINIMFNHFIKFTVSSQSFLVLLFSLATLPYL